MFGGDDNDNDKEKEEGDKEYGGLVKRHSRGGKNKGSITSGKVNEILEMISTIV